MKRLLVVFALLFVFVVPNFAQDQTIAEILITSTSAEDAEFTTLLSAVEAADPAVLDALADPSSTLTVFAPTDAAFEALASSLGQSDFDGILADQVALTEVLFYHVVPGTITSEDIIANLGGSGIEDTNAEGAVAEETATVEPAAEETATVEPGAEETAAVEPAAEETATVEPQTEDTSRAFSVRTLSDQLIQIGGTLNEDGTIDRNTGVTVNNANLVLEMVDIQASNGVIHVIDAVLVPNFDTVADIIASGTVDEDLQFTQLLAAVQAANPGVLELLSDPGASLTVFAPTDAAFEALGEETLNTVLADQELLSRTLTYHVYNGVVYSSSLPESLQMASGDTATISMRDGGVFINDAQIIITDIEAVNGVVHVIDAVIQP